MKQQAGEEVQSRVINMNPVENNPLENQMSSNQACEMRTFTDFLYESLTKPLF